MSTIITFGSNQLPWFNGNPNSVMLVIDKPEQEARNDVVNSYIEREFCTSYPYDEYVEKFKKQYNMKEYTLKEILKGANEYFTNPTSSK